MRAQVVFCVLLVGCISPGADLSDLSRIERLLWGVAEQVVIEIDYVAEREPSALALDALDETLRKTTSKDIVLVGPGSASLSRAESPSHEWTRDMLVSFARENKDRQSAAYLHVLYVDGHYGSALGVNFGDTSFVFMDQITNLGSFPLKRNIAPGDAERSVLIHEVGHALGLVNNGVPMVKPHEHPEDDGHSNNRDSVMWPTADTYAGMLAMIGADEPLPYAFDADDLADLAAFRASEPKR